MRFAALLFAFLAQPAAANPALLDFMGGQGCTFGEFSRAAARKAGHTDAEMEALIAFSLANGTAQQQRDYLVLDETICTIRLPDIQSPYSVASPETVAITSAIDAYAADGMSGCYLEDPPALFDALKGGKPGDGFKEHFEFMAAALIAGDLAMYETSPMRAPWAFQVVANDCANVPQIDGIRRSHRFLVAGFGQMIRKLGAESVCEDDDFPNEEFSRALIVLQRGDPDAFEDVGPEVNHWLWMEILMISLAAGWREGMTGTQNGTPRPPMCHYR